MPTCPGCEHAVSYEQLPIHVEHCDHLDESETSGRALERLEHRLERTEDRLLGRIRHLEATIERGLAERDRQPPGNSRLR